MNEEWREIKGFEGRYAVSNLGRVKSLPRLVNNHTGEINLKGKILKQRPDNKGYMRIDIKDNSGKKKYMGIHRVVALTFIDNPLNKPQVNHIDGNKSNNNVDNLEWVTNSENQIHAYKRGLNYVTGRAGRKKKEVCQIDIQTGKIMKIYPSIADAQRVMKCSNIGECCRHKYGRKTSAGYGWEFREEVVL